MKAKAGITAIAATLVLTPSGVAFAHNGNNDHKNNRNQQAQSWDRHGDKNKDHNRHKDRNDGNRLTCEERQNRATEQFNAYKDKAQQRYNGLSLYLGNQQSFVTTNNLSIEKYDELNNKAVEAQTNSANALASAQAPTIDCDKSERKDGETVYRSIRDMHKSIEKFEDRVQDLSKIITDKVVIS